MPRYQSPTGGASERMVVSPGREAEGILHMPGGQSGHPMSPHYRDSHAAWVEGEATPFLPGPAVHVLTLEPAGP
jgi:penicillin amidase